jgi:crossover junction endodeoxyribonuclease RuvC
MQRTSNLSTNQPVSPPHSYAACFCRHLRYFVPLMVKKSNIILGIDPGSVIMGHGIIEVTGKAITLIEMGVLKMSSKEDAYDRLKQVYSAIETLVKKYKPDTFAIEAPFFGKNVQSMLKLGRAQGVAIAAAMRYGVPVTEYSPKKVKQAITGNGNASKEQVMKMLERIVTIKEGADYFDATDAVAVAICHHFQQTSPLAATLKKAKGWDDFISKNPERVK